MPSAGLVDLATIWPGARSRSLRAVSPRPCSGGGGPRSGCGARGARRGGPGGRGRAEQVARSGAGAVPGPVPGGRSSRGRAAVRWRRGGACPRSCRGLAGGAGRSSSSLPRTVLPPVLRRGCGGPCTVWGVNESVGSPIRARRAQGDGDFRPLAGVVLFRCRPRRRRRACSSVTWAPSREPPPAAVASPRVRGDARASACRWPAASSRLCAPRWRRRGSLIRRTLAPAAFNRAPRCRVARGARVPCVQPCPRAHVFLVR
jgi:hypothetical protein